MKMSLKTTYVSGNCLIRIMVWQDDSKMYHSSQVNFINQVQDL
jgi:hypothetical protein